MKIFFCAFALLLWNIFSETHASIVAVIDTGVDVNHVDLASSIWVNPVDLAGNHDDEDQNGFLNDVYGWNFADNSSVLIDAKYTSYLTPEVKKFFQIQSDVANGNIDRASIFWARKKLEDEGFLRKLNIYGNFMHGTHVGGIAVKGTRDAKLLGVKVGVSEAPEETGRRGVIWREKEIKRILSYVVEATVERYAEIIDYLNGHHADIVNLSIGINAGALEIFLEEYLSPSAGDISALTEKSLNELVQEGRNVIATTPEMLFVMAAGNDGTDNDVVKSFPANINLDNTITVAATHEDRGLASFSNYGKRTVDIAAPGVAIRSTVPGDEYLFVSGTSQATPFVTRAASMVKDSNPSLMPREIKEILMRTVTKKNFLKGKVVSEGVLHQERAVYAAELSNVMDLDSAINYSLKEIKDTFVVKSNGNSGLFAEELKELVLPLPRLLTL